MKRALFFSWPQISHLKPLFSLFDELKKSNYDVYCVSKNKYKSQIEQHCNFIEYPYDAYSVVYPEYIDELTDKKSKCLEEGNNKEFIRLMFKIGSVTCYDEKKEHMDSVRDIINFVKPNVIFRDAAERVSSNVAKEMGVRCIGYITNNMNSFELFESNPLLYLPQALFLNPNLSQNVFSEGEYMHMREYLTNISHEIVDDLNLSNPKFCIQNDPQEEKNIIFSSKYLQSPFLSSEREYIIYPPTNDRFEIEKNIPDDIINFMSGKLPIVYISMGSIITKKDLFYKTYIEHFLSAGFKVIVTWNKDPEHIKAVLGDIYLNNNLLIRPFLPQQYVLSNATLFISCGGFNSLLETIKYMVPIFVEPSSGEQNLNGLLIEELGIGYSSNTIHMNKKGRGQLLRELITDPKFKENLIRLNTKIFSEVNNECVKNIIKWIEEK